MPNHIYVWDVVTGLIVYGGEQQAGPLAGMFSKDTGEGVEDLHEFLADVTLAPILFHIAGVAAAVGQASNKGKAAKRT